MLRDAGMCSPVWSSLSHFSLSSLKMEGFMLEALGVRCTFSFEDMEASHVCEVWWFYTTQVEGVLYGTTKILSLCERRRDLTLAQGICLLLDHTRMMIARLLR